MKTKTMGHLLALPRWNMKHLAKSAFIVACVLIIGLRTSLWAMDPTPLPALQMMSLDGQPVKTTDLPNKGNWLLIYVNPKSHFSDAMLKQMKKDEYPDLAANAVFFVGGTVDDAKALRARYPDLAAAAWYADPNRDAFMLLKMHGVPSVIGISGQTMKWTANGLASDTVNFKTILNSWIRTPG